MQREDEQENVEIAKAIVNDSWVPVMAAIPLKFILLFIQIIPNFLL